MQNDLRLPKCHYGCSHLHQINKTNNWQLGGRVRRVAGGNWGRMSAPQQNSQPLADPPSPDNIKIILGKHQRDIQLNEIKDCEDAGPWTSCMPQRNSTKISAPIFVEPPLPSTPSFFKWVALSTTLLPLHYFYSPFLRLEERELRYSLPKWPFPLLIDAGRGLFLFVSSLFSLTPYTLKTQFTKHLRCYHFLHV